MDKNYKKIQEFEELHYRKSNVIFVLRLVLFLIGLILMFAFLSIIDSPEWKSSVLEFFLLVEVVIVICTLESYMNTLTIWKDWLIIESWIILKHKTEIPYNKINSVNVYSIFWLWTLEIFTWNDVITRYKFLANYDNAVEMIKSRINSDKE